MNAQPPKGINKYNYNRDMGGFLVPYEEVAQPLADTVKVFFLVLVKIGLWGQSWGQSNDEYPRIHLQHGEPSLGKIDQRHARVSNRQK
jgi:hypothetical protein